MEAPNTFKTTLSKVFSKEILFSRQFVLLDPVRDADFLNQSFQDALGNIIPDMGLGNVDNFIIFYTSIQAPNNVNKVDAYGHRLYPYKAFWLGSPQGTTDLYSIFCADIDEEKFYPGAKASEYLVNPRLVLSRFQAGADIVNWFNANYPGGATNGVGNTNSGSSSAYGALLGGNSPVGNVSRMLNPNTNGIDGQIHPVYDYVDNSIILYFTIKTPNANTKALYCYKTMDSEITSPLSSSQFLGGCVTNFWANSSPTPISSHRFSILSPDPNNTLTPVSGQQSAIIAYAGGTYGSATTDTFVDHARWLWVGLVQDIHANPINLSTVTTGNTVLGLDTNNLNSVDKIGSIFPVQTTFSGNHYGILFNAVNVIDRRSVLSGLDPLILSSMQIRIAFFHFAQFPPYFPSKSFGKSTYSPMSAVLVGDLISPFPGAESTGYCRPQYTTFPDGIPKIIYNQFRRGNALHSVFQYIDPERLKPENQKRLIYSQDFQGNPWYIPTYGKKKVTLYQRALYGYLSATGNTNIIYYQQYWEIYRVMAGADYGNALGNTHPLRTLIPINIKPNTTWYTLSGVNFTDFNKQLEIEDPPPYIIVQGYGGSGGQGWILGVLE